MDLLNYTLTLTDDIVFALCSSLRQDIKNCSIQYTLDPYYRNMNSPVLGPINIPFQILTIIHKDSTLYYHQATVITNTSAKVILRSSNVFTTAIHDTSGITVTTLPCHLFQLALKTECQLYYKFTKGDYLDRW